MKTKGRRSISHLLGPGVSPLLFCGAAALLVFFASGIVDSKWSFYSGFRTLPHALKLGFAALVVSYFFLCASSKFPTAILQKLPVGILLCVQCYLAWVFLRFADGRLIFSDDSPSFLYRLAVLHAHFPTLGLYNPEWNAGFPMTELPVVGVLGIYALSWPLLAWGGNIATLEGASTYTLLVPYLFIFVVPWSIFFATRVLGFERVVAALAGVLALGPTVTYFEWLLKFGTIGFVLAAGLFPVCFALCYRVGVSDATPRFSDALLAAVASFLVLSWPMSGVAFIPLLTLACISPSRLFSSERLSKSGLFLILILISYGPVFSATLFQSRAASILAEDKSSLKNVKTESRQKAELDSKQNAASGDELDVAEEGKISEGVRSSWIRLVGPLLRFNPLILAFLVPGLLLLPDRRLRVALFCTLGWLFLLGGFGDLLRPQLEFKRLFVQMSFLSTIIVAYAVVEFIRSVFVRRSELLTNARGQLVLLSLLLATVFGGVLLSPIAVANAYRSSSDEPFVFAPAELNELVSAIRDFGGAGRTVFPSFLLHELGATAMNSQDGGHVAPLTLFTGKQLYAFHFYHVHWTGIDAVPEAFRKRGGAGIEEFLDLVNASAVVTIDKIWRRHFGKLENYYPAYKGKRFRLYTRTSDKLGYFLKGSGEIQVKEQQLSVIVAEPDVVIKFRYYPRLRIDPALGEIYPVPVFEEEVGRNRREQVNFIGLRATPRAIAERLPIELKF